MQAPHSIIIGNGISGITAARHLRKLTDHRITVISAESKYFFSRTALMYIYMGHMKVEQTQPYEPGFWKKNRIDLMKARIDQLDPRRKVLSTSDGKVLAYDQLVLATGSKPNKFGWQGQDLRGVQGLYSLQDLELLEANTHAPFTPASRQRVKTAVIVGGGLIGVELAEMLLTRNIKVIMLIREPQFWGSVLPPEDAVLIAGHIQSHGVDLMFNTELSEILPDVDGRVRAIRTTNGETITCEFVGLTAGVSPNIDFIRSSEIETDRGILVDECLRTNYPEVFAAGDCAQFKTPPKGRKSIEQVWYTGRMMGECVAETISGMQTMYLPGPWFNSAKFFDIEYQTYGRVDATMASDERRFFWRHPTLQIAVHLVWQKETEVFRGINCYGVRLRHQLFDQWLTEGALVTEIIAGLRSANFDPEFYRRYEDQITKAFKDQTQSDLSRHKQSNSNISNL